MVVTCQVASFPDQPLQGMVVSLRCLDYPEYLFEGYTDEEGKISLWFPVGLSWGRSFPQGPGSAGRVLTTNNSSWRLCFETGPYVSPGAPFPRVRVDFYVNQKSHHDIQLILIDGDDYDVLDNVSPLPLNPQGEVSIQAHLPTSTPMPSGLPNPEHNNTFPSNLDASCSLAAPNPDRILAPDTPPRSPSAGQSPIRLEDILKQEPAASGWEHLEGMTGRPAETTNDQAGTGGKPLGRPKRPAAEAFSSPDLAASAPPAKRRRAPAPTSVRRSARLMEKHSDCTQLG